MIELQNIVKTYKGRNALCHALHGIDLHIAEGQYVSIVGASGCGKSTLLKIIGLMDLDFEGTYRFHGNDVLQMNDTLLSNSRREIGFIFQDFQLIERMTVYKNLAAASLIKQNKEDRSEIMNCLQRVGMEAKTESYPDELSGGQKQRVAIARAMLTRPRLIIADEPTGAVDRDNAAAIMELLRLIHEEDATTIVLVTHDREIAKQAGRQIELRDGEVIRDEISVE